jgi:hypothetical protein
LIGRDNGDVELSQLRIQDINAAVDCRQILELVVVEGKAVSSAPREQRVLQFCQEEAAKGNSLLAHPP